MLKQFGPSESTSPKRKRGKPLCGLSLALRASGFCLALLTALVGCGQGTRLEPPPTLEGGEPSPLTTGFEGGRLEPSLAELLAKPRRELAELCDETLETIRVRRAAHDHKHTTVGPFGALRPSLAVPIFREAKFSPEVGFSLPPYLPAGKHDADLALHLARWGDAEAAHKLLDPSDRDTRTRIDALALETNVPLEWARLTALRQQAALLRLALNDPEGAVDLVTLHRQVRAALGTRALQGPLGGALLRNGRRALQHAAVAWRERNRPELAEQAERAVQNWGEAPFPEPGLPIGHSWSETVRALQAKEDGRVARADVLRGLDLLGLPLCEVGAQAVLAFRDGDQLGEMLVLYRTVGTKAHREPGHLALGLENFSTGVADDAKSHGLARRHYTLGRTVYEVALTPRTGLVSGFVRIAADKAAHPPTLPRDFGVVHLDRPFEQNRVQVAPSQTGDVLRTTKAAVLERLQNPLRPAGVVKLEVQREPGQTATAGFTLTYAPADASPALADLALSAWAAWGASRFEPGEDEHGAYLQLSWTDVHTRIGLRLPYTQTEPVTLHVRDARPAADRDSAAAEFDLQERKARLTSGKPLVRLPRSVEPIGVTLGMPREQVEAHLPSGRGVYTRPTEQGLMTTLTGEAPRGSLAVPRQVFVRFDGNSKVGEVRVRFEELGAGSQKRGVRDLLDGLQRQGGSGVEGPAPWSALWPDRSATLRTWRDDLTVVTYQADAAGAEVSVRDCPPDRPEGVELPPLEYLPRGPESCSLGTTRDELFRKWNVQQPVTTADGAVVLHPAKGSPYDVLLVYFTDGKAERILARHAQDKPLPVQPAALATVLRDTWGRELRTLGWPRRQDLGLGGAVQALSFHDERTQVKLFWQDDSKGKPSVFTEWRDTPR